MMIKILLVVVLLSALITLSECRSLKRRKHFLRKMKSQKGLNKEHNGINCSEECTALINNPTFVNYQGEKLIQDYFLNYALYGNHRVFLKDETERCSEDVLANIPKSVHFRNIRCLKPKRTNTYTHLPDNACTKCCKIAKVYKSDKALAGLADNIIRNKYNVAKFVNCEVGSCLFATSDKWTLDFVHTGCGTDNYTNCEFLTEASSKKK